MRQIALGILLIPCLGCGPYNQLVNRMLASRCEFREVEWKPGFRYIDYDREPRTWMEVGPDGKHRPIPTPVGEKDPQSR